MHWETLLQKANRSAADAAQAQFVAALLGERLLAQLDYLKSNPQTILELGSGHGALAPLLEKRFPNALVVQLDFAQARLHHSPTTTARLCADARLLPLANASVDLVLACDFLHWLDPLPMGLAEILRVLKAPGVFLFSALGPDTLQELHSAQHQAGWPPSVLPLAPMAVYGDALLQTGFQDPVVDRERLTLAYPSLKLLAQDLKARGVAHTTHPGLLTPRRWQALEAHYPKPAGELPVTLELIQGQAWKLKTELKNASEISVPLHAITRAPR